MGRKPMQAHHPQSGSARNIGILIRAYLLGTGAGAKQAGFKIR